MKLEAWMRAHGISGDGRQWTVVLDTARRLPSYLADKRTGDLVFRIPEAEPRERAACLLTLVRTWADEVIPKAVAVVGQRMEMSGHYRRVSVRDQNSRWGSCSSTGTLSFNWRLVLLPWELHQYVLIHEFGHFAHMDHSGKFWDFLHRYDADAGRHDQALNRMGRQVIGIGRV